MFVQTVDAPPLERIVFDVAAAPLLLAVLLLVARLRRQGRKAPVRGKGLVERVVVGIVQAGAHDGRFEIVMPYAVGTPPNSQKACSCSRRKVSTFWSVTASS